MADTLTPEEKETIMQYDMRTGMYTITTIVPKHIRRFTKLFGKGESLDRFGTIRWIVPRMPSLPPGAGQKPVLAK